MEETSWMSSLIASEFIQQFLTQDFARVAIMGLLLWIVRVVLLKSLVALGRSSLAERYRITKTPLITDKQLERESVWPLGYFLDFIAVAALYGGGRLHNIEIVGSNFLESLVWHIAVHATLVEFVYYWFHRFLHVPIVYKWWHQYHHKSINTEPTTGVSFEIGERLSYTVLFAISPVVCDFYGKSNLLMFFLYFISFDIMNEGGHINFDVMPAWFHSSVLKYVVYSPVFHAVHHTKFKKNYSLFMPWPDMLFGSAVHNSDPSSKKSDVLPVTSQQKQVEKELDFVLLVHAGYTASTFYSRMVHPFEAIGNFFTRFLNLKHKFEQKPWLYLFYPYIVLYLFYIGVLGRIGFHTEETFEVTTKSSHKNQDVKRNLHGSTWIIHNLAAMYLVPAFKHLINDRIEQACQTASQQGVKVVVLGNFNKAEWMNHGGTDIVKNLDGKLGNTVISHGDTLSAAVILQYALTLRQQGYWNKSVMVTGSTSKIGRALCLSLAKLAIPVKMFSQSKARFDEIASEITDPVARACLHFTPNLKEGLECDLWLTGKMIPSGQELLTAIPDDATVVNFSVPDPLTPELLALRPDLLHLDSGLLAFDDEVMSPDFTWLLPKGTIYACLAGGIVHSALGNNKHEVGAVEVDMMQVYWDQALRIGFKLPQHTSFYEPITLPPPKHLPILCEV